MLSCLRHGDLYVCRRSPTGGVGSQLQARGGPGEDQLEPLGPLWNEVIDDLHLHRLVPLAVHEMEHLDTHRVFIQRPHVDRGPTRWIHCGAVSINVSVCARMHAC